MPSPRLALGRQEWPIHVDAGSPLRPLADSINLRMARMLALLVTGAASQDAAPRPGHWGWDGKRSWKDPEILRRLVQTDDLLVERVGIPTPDKGILPRHFHVRAASNIGFSCVVYLL